VIELLGSPFVEQLFRNGTLWGWGRDGKK